MMVWLDMPLFAKSKILHPKCRAFWCISKQGLDAVKTSFSHAPKASLLEVQPYGSQRLSDMSAVVKYAVVCKIKDFATA